jgi:hypothetical protein
LYQTNIFVIKCSITDSFINSFDKCLLSAYHLPGLVAGTEDTMVSRKDSIPAFSEPELWWGREWAGMVCHC